MITSYLINSINDQISKSWEPEVERERIFDELIREISGNYLDEGYHSV